MSKPLHISALALAIVVILATLLFNLHFLGGWYRSLMRSASPADEILVDAAFNIGVVSKYNYPLEFSHFGFYEVGLRVKNESQVPSSFQNEESEYKFGGKIKIALLKGNRVLKSEIVDTALVYRHAPGNITQYREVVLKEISLPYQGYSSGLTLSVEVLEPDLELSRVGGAALYVGESRVP